MRKVLPELVGTAGFCLFATGLYLQFGAGVALIVGGVLLMAAALKAVWR